MTKYFNRLRKAIIPIEQAHIVNLRGGKLSDDYQYFENALASYFSVVST